MQNAKDSTEKVFYELKILEKTEVTTNSFVDKANCTTSQFLTE